MSPFGSYRLNLGKYGERLAQDFLERRGVKIIEQNYHTRYGEIDLIGTVADEILFFEVKTRTNNHFGYPEQAVNNKKIANLLLAIEIYLAEKNIDNFWRLDVISVEIDKHKKIARIRWFKYCQI